MPLRGLKRNAAWNIAEVLVSSIVLFVLYRIILMKLGPSALGVWSLVLATTSFARLADLGAASGLGRYVAVSQARAESDGANGAAFIYVETALISNALLYVLLAGVMYWPAWWALGSVTEGDATTVARQLLPYAIAAFVMQNISNVVAAALVGLHKSYRKSQLMLFTLSIQALVSVAAIRPLGLSGIALGQIVQCLLLLLLGWVAVVRLTKGRFQFIVPYRMAMGPLRDLIGFGARLQGLNIAAFLFEPLTKFVFAAVGGVGALGMYELASRGILQVRQLVVAPSQNLMPLFAAQFHTEPESVRPLYERALITMIVGAGASMAVMSLGSPIISYIWLQRVDPLFVILSFVLASGWLCNMISAPGYLLGVSTGMLRWNIAGGLLSTLLGPTLGAALAQLWGGTGVAVGAMVAMGLGSLTTWFLNCRALRIPILPSIGSWSAFLRRILATPRRLSFKK